MARAWTQTTPYCLSVVLPGGVPVGLSGPLLEVVPSPGAMQGPPGNQMCSLAGRRPRSVKATSTSKGVFLRDARGPDAPLLPPIETTAPNSGSPKPRGWGAAIIPVALGTFFPSSSLLRLEEGRSVNGFLPEGDGWRGAHGPRTKGQQVDGTGLGGSCRGQPCPVALPIQLRPRLLLGM